MVCSKGNITNPPITVHATPVNKTRLHHHFSGLESWGSIRWQWERDLPDNCNCVLCGSSASSILTSSQKHCDHRSHSWMGVPATYPEDFVQIYSINWHPFSFKTLFAHVSNWSYKILHPAPPYFHKQPRTGGRASIKTRGAQSIPSVLTFSAIIYFLYYR